MKRVVTVKERKRFLQPNVDKGCMKLQTGLVTELKTSGDRITVTEAHQRALQLEKTLSHKSTSGQFVNYGGVPSSRNMASSTSENTGNRSGVGASGRHRLSECPRPAKKVLFIDPTKFNEEDAEIGKEPQLGVEEVAIKELVDGDTGTMLMMVNTRLHFSSAYHPQTDGQTKVVNRALGDLLRCLVGDNVWSWDLKLSQAEFAHNHAFNKSSGFSPFQVVYSIIPRSLIYLLPLPSKTRVHGKAEDFVHNLQEVYKQVQENLSHSAERYKLATEKKRRHLEFDVGNFVWAVLTKDKFAVGEYNKLAARKIGPLEILEKINPNAYRLKLPTHIRTHDMFNIKHLIPFHGDSSNDETVGNSRSNFLQPGENDAAAIDDMALEFMEGWDRKRPRK
ncbi:hypothetical protein JRO89_XS01G0075400 [Xanthoceras sorbifolium]|uniref:Tf2-1-like SH3-like domain-containing protein n=1 Tax=Xanthoceras sorbifolium TaxID=99658 RepID=A0ABQ8IID2_9ROSI|nr:hypothetical protein JRO89_XS01G0075400 [Xanthoceras sorbifolium]